MVVYLASPMASTEERVAYSLSQRKLSRNKAIAQKLVAAGFDVYLPQDHQKGSDRETLAEQLRVIQECEFLVLLLSDTRGIYLEAGYAKALGKRVYALEVEETRKYSPWLAAFFDYVAKDSDELVRAVSASPMALRK